MLGSTVPCSHAKQSNSRASCLKRKAKRTQLSDFTDACKPSERQTYHCHVQGISNQCKRGASADCSLLKTKSQKLEKIINKGQRCEYNRRLSHRQADILPILHRPLLLELSKEKEKKNEEMCTQATWQERSNSDSCTEEYSTKYCSGSWEINHFVYWFRVVNAVECVCKNNSLPHISLGTFLEHIWRILNTFPEMYGAV